MAYRKSMSKGASRRNFKRGNASKRINHQPKALGMRGGIRL